MRWRLPAGLVAGALLGLAGVVPLSAPAWAKADYTLAVRERQVRVGETIHVTAGIDDDSVDGQPKTLMCLFQMPGPLPPRGPGNSYQLPVTYSYRAVAGCRKVTPVHGESNWNGASEFLLEATAPGRLTLVSIVDNDGGLAVAPPYEKGQPAQYVGTPLATVDVIDPRASKPSTTPAAVVELPVPARSGSVSPSGAAVAGAPGRGGPSWALLGVATAGGLVAGAAITGLVLSSRLRRRSRA